MFVCHVEFKQVTKYKFDITIAIYEKCNPCFRYVPDRRTGWHLPDASSPQYKSHLLGVKLACGFEILTSQAKPSQDVEDDKGWKNYLKSLEDKGYFRNLLEHSRDYNNLLNKAKEYYINHRDSMHYAPVIGQEILGLTKNLDYKPDELQKEGSNLPKDDDESWMNISPEELDKMLQERFFRLLDAGNLFKFNLISDTGKSEISRRITTRMPPISLLKLQNSSVTFRTWKEQNSRTSRILQFVLHVGSREKTNCTSVSRRTRNLRSPARLISSQTHSRVPFRTS